MDRNLRMKLESTTYLHAFTRSNLLNCGQYLFRCSDKSGNYSKYASVVYTNDYVAVVKPK